MTEIEVAHLEEDQKVTEKLPAEPLGGKRYQLMGSPALVAGLASGDEIELDPREPTGYRLLKHGMNLCIQIHARRCNKAMQDAIAHGFESLGGRFDGVMESPKACIVVCSVSVFATFDRIEKTMDQLARKFRFEGWTYGNVYDLATGEPLNWWPE
jgi:hypothetical protein